MYKVNDKEKVNQIFRALRKAGFEAKQSFDWNKATDEQQESKNIIWIDSLHISREKGYENYMSDGMLNKQLVISWSLTPEKLTQAVEIMSQFDLEIVAPQSEWNPIIIKPTSRKVIEGSEYLEYAYLKIDSIKDSVNDYNIDGFLELCEKQYNNRTCDEAWKVARRLYHKGHVEECCGIAWRKELEELRGEV